MKNHTPFEAIATLLAIVGIFILVGGLMPVINPGFLEVKERRDYSPRLIFLAGVLLSLPLLGLSWHFNKKAQSIRQQLQQSSRPPKKTWEKWLKWILFGFLVLWVLSAFLF
jgi:ABC-type Fe3+ transport system permease subunit